MGPFIAKFHRRSGTKRIMISMKANKRRDSLVLKSVVQKLRVVEIHMLMTVKEIASTNKGRAFSRTKAGSTANSVARGSGVEMNAGRGTPNRVVSRKDSTSSAPINPMLPLKVGRAMRSTTWERPKKTGSIINGGRQPIAGL